MKPRQTVKNRQCCSQPKNSKSGDDHWVDMKQLRVIQVEVL